MDVADLYKRMVRIRAVEDALAREYPAQRIRCPVHLSTGQEAVAVGVCAHLRRGDRVFSTHRCHAHYLAKGGCLKKMVAELFGKAAGCCRGRGGSMHLYSDEAEFVAVPIVASALPIAVGAARADKQQGNGRRTVCFVGDAAPESGQFWEALNLAAVWKVPLLVVMEDNGLSVTATKGVRRPDGMHLGRAVESLGVKMVTSVVDRRHGYSWDGMSVEDVFAAAGEALAAIDAGRGPAFLEFMVTRLCEHCGPNEAPEEPYRGHDWLYRFGVFDAAADGARLDAEKEFDAAVAAALASPDPDPATLCEGVFG